MARQSWDEKAQLLEKLIRDIDAHHGGDDPEFLERYIDYVIKKYASNLDSAILCMKDAHPEYQRIRYLRDKEHEAKNFQSLK